MFLNKARPVSYLTIDFLVDVCYLLVETINHHFGAKVETVVADGHWINRKCFSQLSTNVVKP